MISFITSIPFLLLQSDDALTGEETAIAITAIAAGSIMITVIAAIATWQLIGAWRTRMAVGREKAYQELSDEMAKSQRRTDVNVQRLLDEMVELRNRTAEIERMLKEVG
jgi:hypothetical protein